MKLSHSYGPSIDFLSYSNNNDVYSSSAPIYSKDKDMSTK